MTQLTSSQTFALSVLDETRSLHSATMQLMTNRGLRLRLLTHNLRYAKDPPLECGEAPWSERKSRIISQLLYNVMYTQEALICLQEALHVQVHDVLAGLKSGGEDWAFVGVGRDDGHHAGEYSPIFYRTSVWKVEEFRTIWLSLTPDRPSKSWDAASIRILTIAKLRHHQSDQSLHVMNTHLDDQGSLSRLEAAKIIKSQVEARTAQPEEHCEPLLLAGDFNSETHMEAYSYLTSDFRLLDARREVPKEMRYGHRETFSGFDSKSVRPVMIDFIFVNGRAQHGSVQNPWRVKGYTVLENLFDDGVYCSDHRAVVVDLLWRC